VISDIAIAVQQDFNVRFAESIRRTRNRQMCFELLCAFMDRALAENNLDQAVKIYEIIDGFPMFRNVPREAKA
jgi:hypothetical protein